ncbi:MAG: OmpA family protein [Gemmatimonadales bacterium]
MRRLLNTSLILLASAMLPHTTFAQSVISSSNGTLAGTRELGVFAAGRVLSTKYSVSDGRLAFGGAMTFATHLKSMFAVEGGLAATYGRQLNSYYKPPLFVFTPTISLLIQKSSTVGFQPYALIGGGYEFVRFTQPRCDCDQNLSLGVANVGVGFRKMIGDTRAFRAQVTSQIGSGGAAFTGMAGMSFIIGTPGKTPQKRPMRIPTEVRKEPPLIPVPKQRVTVQPSRPPAAAPAPAPVAPPAANRPVGPSNLPTGRGAVLLQIDGTQVDFSKTTWRDDAEPMIDGLVVDLTSDAGQEIKVSIEAHTDNIGSNAGNIMLGLDRARAVRDYLVTQGVAPNRITISSAGEDKAIAPNTTAIGRQLNRRIIIKRDN